MNLDDRPRTARPHVWRALLWKEWRQLRLLRWACTGLGISLPLFFLAGAEMGRQGLSPLGRVASYSVTTILTDAVPGALALAVWPLAALLLVAQAFAGDRSAGTEAFLLERPVSRARIWFVRLAGSTASLVVVITVTMSLWALWYDLAGAPSSQGWGQPLHLLALGSGLAFLAAICAVIASSLLSAPLLAILAAAIFAALPAGASAGLGGLFPHVLLRGVPIGLLVPWLLVPAYLVVSYLAFCRGEPAGRGRAARGIGGLALALIAVAFMFVMSAQAALRHVAAHPNASGRIHPAPVGDAAIVGQNFYEGDNGFWLIDTKTARVLEHYPPPCMDVLWKPDGTMFALATYSGPLGSDGRARVSFFDAHGEPCATPYYFESPFSGDRLRWSGDRLIIREAVSPSLGRLIVFVPGKGEVGRLDVDLPYSDWDYAGRLWDGSDAVVRTLPGYKEPGERNDGPPTQYLPIPRVPYGLYRADLIRGRIDSTPLLQDIGPPWGWRSVLSPDGRWWIRETAKDATRRTGSMGTHARPSLEMLELPTGRVVPWSQGGWPDDPARYYLTGDRDATSLVREGPDRIPKRLASWSHLVVSLSQAPQGRYLFIRTQRTGAVFEPAIVTDDLLYDVESDSSKDLGRPLFDNVPAVPGGLTTYIPCRQWAGPRTLAYASGDILAFEDVDAIGKLRYVVGGP